MIDVAPGDFTPFLRNLRQAGYVGGNITIPHKERAFSLVDRADDAAGHIGAVNTVWLEDDALCGTNTDWTGFSDNMDACAPGWEQVETAVILGAGGAARGILYALATRGIERVRIINRTRPRAEALARDFAGLFASPIEVCEWQSLPEAFAGSGLLINTTSIWMEADGAPVPDLSPLSSRAIVSDIVYIPLQTPLLAAAQERKLTTVGGLGMLLHQAVPGFEHWFGIRPEVTEDLRNLIVRDMENHR